MTFTSFEFLLYFPVAVLFFNIVPQRFRVWYLLVVGYAFYAMMQPVYLLLLAGVTGMTYGFARWIAKTEDDTKRNRLLAFGIICVLFPLFFFKYYDFVNEQISSLMGIEMLIPKMGWMLPVGISFYTFMAIGYLVDVNNEEVEVENNIETVGLFLSFFPIVLSGPIERAGNMFPQFKNLRKSTPSDLTCGAKLMLWGYFMKLCVADRLGLYVNTVFEDMFHHNGTTLLLASLLYPIQVYADLGGYSLLAIGVARCMGINIIPNFRRPFFAKSVSEFWQRWHMSLINWLTDYIYTPISFVLRRMKVWGIVIALFITFLVSGIWHGASWTCIVWGLVNGVFLGIEAIVQDSKTKMERQYDLTNRWWYILICCSFVYLFFSFTQVIGLSGSISNSWTAYCTIFGDGFKMPYLQKRDLIYALICGVILFTKDFCDEFKPSIKVLDSNYKWVRYTAYYAMVLMILELMANGQSFIYFKF